MVWFRVEKVGSDERLVIRNTMTISEVISKGKFADFVHFIYIV